MAKKPTLTSIGTGYASATTLDANFNAIRSAFDNTLSRDGSTPNTMSADFDMNSNDILNVGTANVSTLKINGVAVATSEALATKTDVKYTYETVADLLADTQTYTFFTAGDVVVAGGYWYEVAASGAADEHVTTAGGVKLYVSDYPGATVEAFGAVTDGTDAAGVTTAISAMETAFSRVVFGPGNHAVNDVTVTNPIYFLPGGYVTVQSTQTLTIRAPITSPRQYVFRGSGSYSLEQNTTVGENSKQVHASWFGAFPSPTDTTDQAPFIQAAIDAMGNTREGVIEFDNGNYHISSAVTVNRGIRIVGAGTRRTVFKADADGYDMFTTAGVAVRFEHLQFEADDSLSGFTGTSIVLNHQDCEVDDVRFFNTDFGVEVNANYARITHIGGAYGYAPAASSALVHVASGSGILVEDVYALTSSLGPAAMVKVGGGGAVSNFTISGVQHVTPSRSVWIEGSAGNITRGVIDNVIYGGFSGTPTDYQIDIESSSTYSVTQISVDGYQISGYATNGIRLLQSSTGTMGEISIGRGSIDGSSGIGLRIEQTAGTLTEVRVSSGFSAIDRATPISYSGTMSKVRVDPLAVEGANSPITYYFSMADDTAESIDLRQDIFSSSAILTSGTSEYGIFLVRAVSGTETITSITTPSTNVNTTTGALTGTTGTDTKFTFSVSGNTLYLENRLGSTQAVTLTLGIGQ